MNSRAAKPVNVQANSPQSPAQTLWSIVRKSALLNLVIVLTSSPVLILAGGSKAIVPTLKIMVGLSIVIWTATFALFSLVTIPRIFRTPASLASRRDSRQSPNESGVADHWLDAPPGTDI
jgi:hypothetical protein